MYSSTSNNNNQESNDRLNVDFINDVPTKPEISTSICLKDSKSLQSFLKLSRSATDDNLRSDLNSILNRNEENKNSIFKFNNNSINSNESPCIPFLNKLIYPEWKKRIDIITFCQNELNNIVDGNNSKMEDDGFSNLTLEEKNNLLRIDPYTYKNLEQNYLQKNAQFLALQNLYNNEATIETIITRRSIELMNDLCNFGHFDVMDNFIKYTNSLTKDN